MSITCIRYYCSFKVILNTEHVQSTMYIKSNLCFCLLECDVFLWKIHIRIQWYIVFSILDKNGIDSFSFPKFVCSLDGNKCTYWHTVYSSKTHILWTYFWILNIDIAAGVILVIIVSSHLGVPPLSPSLGQYIHFWSYFLSCHYWRIIYSK